MDSNTQFDGFILFVLKWKYGPSYGIALYDTRLGRRPSAIESTLSCNNQGPLLLTRFNFNPRMDK